MRLLVPLDESDLALSIIPAVRRLLAPSFAADARLAGLLATIPSADVSIGLQPKPSAEVHLLTILRPRRAPREAVTEAVSEEELSEAHADDAVGPEPLLLEPEARKVAEREAKSRLVAIAREHLPEASCRCHVLWSDAPAERIVEFAEEIDADAIAMATHGRSAVARLLAGSVAEGVIRKSARPVVVQRPPMNRDQSAHEMPGRTAHV